MALDAAAYIREGRADLGITDYDRKAQTLAPAMVNYDPHFCVSCGALTRGARIQPGELN